MEEALIDAVRWGDFISAGSCLACCITWLYSTTSCTYTDTTEMLVSHIFLLQSVKNQSEDIKLMLFTHTLAAKQANKTWKSYLFHFPHEFCWPKVHQLCSDKTLIMQMCMYSNFLSTWRRWIPVCVNGGGGVVGGGRGGKVNSRHHLPPLPLLSPPWNKTAAAGTSLEERSGWGPRNLLWCWGGAGRQTGRLLYTSSHKMSLLLIILKEKKVSFNYRKHNFLLSYQHKQP